MDAPIIDFHNHHIPARFSQRLVQASPASERARWEVLARKLSDEDLLLQDIREGDLAARVVNMAPALIAGAEGRVTHETIMAMNDDLAALVARHPGRIYGLASVDAYDGDQSGREAERAIVELGLRGLFVDAEHVIAGSDWPINGAPMLAMLNDAMQQAGLTSDQRNAIGGGNCRRLLGITASPTMRI